MTSDSVHRLRILHLSDLHARGPRETGTWRRRRVLGDAWERNLADLLQDGPIDLVCFTGDAADWGLEGDALHRVDDILIQFDDARTAATLAVLADLAAKTQVILFTHHARSVDEARRLRRPEDVAVHELG